MEIVACGQRPVGHDGYPVAFSARLKTDRPLGVVHSRHAAGRILIALVLVLRTLVLRDLILRRLILILSHRCHRAVQHQQYARQDNSG